MFKDYFNLDNILKLSEKYNISRDKIMDALISGNINDTIETPFHFQIPKPNGKMRDLYTFSKGSIIYQDMVLHYIIDEIGDLSDENVFSYRLGISNNMAIYKVQNFLKENKGCIIRKYDIVDYFNQVRYLDIEKVINDFGRKGIEEEILLYLKKLFSIDKYKDKDGTIHYKKPSLLPGSPLSAYISNLILSEFDKKMSKEKFYIRYADDFLVAEGKLDINDELERYGLKINETKVEKFVGYAEFLGRVVTEDRIDITSGKRRELFLDIRKLIRKKLNGVRDKNERLGMVGYLICTVQNYYMKEVYKDYTRIDMMMDKYMCREFYTELNSYIKDTIRREVLGINNKSMYKKIKEDEFRKYGWIDLDWLFDTRKNNRLRYEALKDSILNKNKILSDKINKSKTKMISIG